MSKKKKILLVVFSLFIILQFIRPADNNSEILITNDISSSIKMSPEVSNILKASCYDCHSNKTNNMWYQNIQPIGWWINHHIEEGKDELNFSEFNTYSLKRRAHKLEEIAEMIEGNEMPLSSYTLIHGEAELNADQKKLIVDWAKTNHDSLKKLIPPQVQK
ncbi:MAG: heme-binding domain-containing protein [Bacteroidota bacterium]|nr:heme-binding domain-containing protein [Bacteroidota bacterium]